MAENKILVQIIDHENGNSVLGQDYFASREKAEEFKRISDRAYGKLLGEGQTRITTEIMERWYQPPFPIAATESCRSDTSSRAPSILYSIQSESELKKPRLISDSTHPADLRLDYCFHHFWASLFASLNATELWAQFYAHPLWATGGILGIHLWSLIRQSY